MRGVRSRPGVTVRELFTSWGSILSGNAPLLSIEITRECPLSCPGCYAYGDNHLGGQTTLRNLSDLRGDALVQGVLSLVEKHRPLHVSLVGGEPLIRHRELSRILPALDECGTFTLVVTSAVIPIPQEWMKLRRLKVAVSVDGLPEHHNERRKPATYERILENIRGCHVNIHWTITHAMLERRGYVEEYLSFWSRRREVRRIWVSLYSPQSGENSAEVLTREDRELATEELLRLGERYPKLLTGRAVRAFLDPPTDPENCLFAKMSVNYSADLRTRVEPCILGGSPDCSQCGCVASAGLHGAEAIKVAGPLRIRQLVRGSVAVGTLVNRMRDRVQPPRWTAPLPPTDRLVQIDSADSEGSRSNLHDH
jgi:MoaA/NifB/PqqE/SkfB family radical SAM enzyme